MKRYEQQRNNVKNDREFDSLTRQIERNDLQSQRAEKIINDTTKLLVADKEVLEALKVELSNRENDLKLKQKELDQIAETTKAEEEELEKQAAVYREAIDDRMLAAYDKVRSNARNKLAVVTVVRGACGGCFNKITPQREIDIMESKKIVVCEYCGRILVNAEKEDSNSEEQPQTEEPKKRTTRKSK